MSEGYSSTLAGSDSLRGRIEKTKVALPEVDDGLLELAGKYASRWRQGERGRRMPSTDYHATRSLAIDLGPNLRLTLISISRPSLKSNRIRRSIENPVNLPCFSAETLG